MHFVSRTRGRLTEIGVHPVEIAYGPRTRPAEYPIDPPTRRE